MVRNLATIGLAPSHTKSLFKAGFRFVEDIETLSARDLSNEAKISISDALSILKVVKSMHPTTEDVAKKMLGASALEIYEANKRMQHILTGIDELDEILGGGFQRRQITEICGVPGVGKTQLAIHICLAAQLVVDPTDKSADKRSQAVFIDSEGSFLIERVSSMASSFVQDFVTNSRVKRDDLLSGITYYRVHDYLEQLEVINGLPLLLHATPGIKAIVMDSAAYHFRHGFDDMNQRSRAMDKLIQSLQRIALEHKVAVILINQMTTKKVKNVTSSDENTMYQTPALGESWLHSMTNRLLLTWENQQRVAYVVKSVSEGNASASFEVNARGVRSSQTT